MDSNKSIRSQSESNKAGLNDYIKTIIYLIILVVVIIFLLSIQNQYNTNFTDSLNPVSKPVSY